MNERPGGELVELADREPADTERFDERTRTVDRIKAFAEEGTALCYRTGRFRRRVHVEWSGDTIRILALDRRAPIRGRLEIQGVGWEAPYATVRPRDPYSTVSPEAVEPLLLREMAGWLEETLGGEAKVVPIRQGEAD